MNNFEPVNTDGAFIADHFLHHDGKEYVVLVRPYEGSEKVKQIEIAEIGIVDGKRYPIYSRAQLYILRESDRKMKIIDVILQKILALFNEFLTSKPKKGGANIPDSASELDKWVHAFGSFQYNTETGQLEAK